MKIVIILGILYQGVKLPTFPPPPPPLTCWFFSRGLIVVCGRERCVVRGSVYCDSTAITSVRETK